MEAIIIIYLIGVVFGFGYVVGNGDYKTDWWKPLPWPFTIVIVIVIGCFEMWKLYFPPIWLDLILVVLFNKKIKANEEPLNNYYNKIREKKHFKSLRTRAIKKIAAQNNITIKASEVYL